MEPTIEKNCKYEKIIGVLEKLLGGKLTEGAVVGNYKNFILQVIVDCENPLMYIQIARVIPENSYLNVSLLRQLNINAYRGSHNIQSLKDEIKCYMYKFPYWIKSEFEEDEIRGVLNKLCDEAEDAYSRLIVF